MAYGKIKIANAGDLQANIDLLRYNNIIKNGGVWELIGHKEVELNSHLFNTLCFLGKLKLTSHCEGSKFYEYKLQACSFDKDEKYYKQLARFTYNRKFWALYDVKRIFAKLGYEVWTEYYDRIFPAAECSMHVKCLIFQKDRFRLILPYFSNIANLLTKNSIYKQIVRIVSELYLFGSKNPKYPYEVSLVCDPDTPQMPPQAILPVLQRKWNYQFKQISDTVLVWANYEEGQYDAIR